MNVALDQRTITDYNIIAYDSVIWVYTLEKFWVSSDKSQSLEVGVPLIVVQT